jgi:preprotein translocase subunit SecF
MSSFNSFSSTNKSSKLFPLAFSALMTFAPLIFFANHSFRLDIKTSTHQVVEMRLLENLIQSNQLPNLPKQLVVPNVVSLPSPVFDAIQNNHIETSITQPTLPLEVVQPKTMNLNVSPKARDSFNKSSQSPIKQLIEEESIKASKKQNEKFANDVKNSAKPDCLKNDHGLGLFNVVPLIYDIVKDKCN